MTTLSALECDGQLALVNRACSRCGGVNESIYRRCDTCREKTRAEVKSWRDRNRERYNSMQRRINAAAYKRKKESGFTRCEHECPNCSKTYSHAPIPIEYKRCNWKRSTLCDACMDLPIGGGES